MNELVESKLSSQQLDLIKSTIAKGATNDEMKLFLYRCEKMGLDPLKPGMIYFVKYGSGPGTIVIGLEGMRSLAAKSGKHTGTQRGVIRDDDGKCIGAWCEVSRSDWTKAAREEVSLHEYNTGKAQWAKMPETMLKKCFDDETEVLTVDGFQLFGELKSAVLQVTDEGLQAVRVKAFAQNYDGAMIGSDDEALNFCATPNHTMVTTDGNIEASALYEIARSRAAVYIPLVAPNQNADVDIEDDIIRLSAALICDGSFRGQKFEISVSRKRKIDVLRALNLHNREIEVGSAGQTAISKFRTIKTLANKQRFTYLYEAVSMIVTEQKILNQDLLMRLSRRQAEILLEAMVFFDGNINEAGVARFYSSNKTLIGQVEVLAHLAGRPVKPVMARYNDLSNRPNFVLTFSRKEEVGVCRQGREFHKTVQKTTVSGGLIEKQFKGQVWCVTVPSGKIIVRRRGLSMICGNCAEAAALRMAFPDALGGIYAQEEMEQTVSQVPTKTKDIQKQIDGPELEIEPDWAPTEDDTRASATVSPSALDYMIPIGKDIKGLTLGQAGPERVAGLLKWCREPGRNITSSMNEFMTNAELYLGSL